MDVRAEYGRRIDERETAVRRIRETERLLSLVRLALFAAIIVIAWLALGPETVAAAWVFAPLAAFIPVAIIHERLVRRRSHLERSAKLYADGIDRIDGRWQGKGDSGDAHRPLAHVYADDLDIFGRGSLFELLSLTRTRRGGATLASWLTGAASEEEIATRQRESAELAPMLDFRETFLLAGEDVDRQTEASTLRDWGSAPPIDFPSGERLLAAVLVVLGIASILLAIPPSFRWIVSLLDLDPAGAALLRNGSLLTLVAVIAADFAFRARTRDRVERVVGAVEQHSHELALHAALLGVVARQKFESESMRNLAAKARERSAAIAVLQKRVALLESRRNQFFAPVAGVLHWSFFFATSIEKWRTESGIEVTRWLDEVARLEALLSIANFRYEHPAYTVPRIIRGQQIVARDLAHPMLPPEGTVPNDFELGGASRLVIVSGSNMSGKSTFLRSLGTNIVLALAGAPVRASYFELPILKIGASIRINDSLQEGASRFFAEITRLREIVALTEAEGTVLFLIDEILNGTNSHDRRIGAEAVLVSLVDRGAMGLATTHDLALTEMASKMGSRARNVHFEEQFEGTTMRFDYLMREGVVARSNALPLMRSIGLDVDLGRRPAETPAMLSGTILRPWRSSDAERLAELADDVEIWRNLRDRFPHPYTLEDAHRFLRGVVGVEPPLNFAIELNGELAGGIGIHPGADVERIGAELGYWLAAQHRGRGVMVEAIRVATRYAFEVIGLERLYADVFEYNEASMKVLEKAGFTREGVARRAALKDGRIVDKHYFAVIRDDRRGMQPAAAAVSTGLKESS